MTRVVVIAVGPFSIYATISDVGDVQARKFQRNPLFQSLLLRGARKSWELDGEKHYHLIAPCVTVADSNLPAAAVAVENKTLMVCVWPRFERELESALGVRAMQACGAAKSGEVINRTLEMGKGDPNTRTIFKPSDLMNVKFDGKWEELCAYSA